MAHECLYRDVPGSDTAVLFVHGIIGTPDHFLPFVPLVPEDWTLHNILLDGHGSSVQAFARSSMQRWIDQVCGEVETISRTHRRIMIGAHSMGALLAMEACLRCPGAVKRLYLMNPALRIRVRYPSLGHAVFAIAGRAPARDLSARAAIASCSITLTRRLWQYLSWLPRYGELFAESARIRSLLPQFTLPCRFIFSAKDALVSPQAWRTVAGYSNMPFCLLPDSAHYYYSPGDLALCRSLFSQEIDALARQ